MICAACEDGHHDECGDGEPFEDKPGVVECGCATKGHPKVKPGHCERYDCDGAVCLCGCLACIYARKKADEYEWRERNQQWS